MKNLIKKTIVMVLLVCSLVSTVGVQPVVAHIKFPEIYPPDRPEDSKSLVNKKLKLEGVYCNQDLLVAVWNPMTDYGVYKNIILQVQKKVKGKYTYFRQRGAGSLDNCQGYEFIPLDSLGLKSGDNIRVRAMYYFETKEGKSCDTKWSKWYNIKVKKNKTINKNIKCNISKNKRGILMYQADKCDGYVIEFCKNKKFKKKDTKTELRLFGVSITTEAKYGISFYDQFPQFHKGMYVRVTPIEFFNDGQIKYYPRSKTIKL